MTGAAETTPPSRAHLWWTLAALIPPAATLAFILRLGVDAPKQDEWNIIPAIDRFLDGAATVADFWHPANEHIAFFPRCVIFGLARLTGWNIRTGMVVTLAFTFATLMFVARVLRQSGAPPWSVAFASALLFSLHAHELWLWSYEVHIAMATFGVTGALALLGSGRLRAATVVPATLLATFASWSFLNGFLVWPLGLVLLALRRIEGPWTRLRALVVFGAGAAITIGLPALTWVRSAAPWCRSVAVLAEFVARYSGAGLLGPGARADLAQLAGWAGTGLLVAGAAATAIRRRPAEYALAAISGFGLGSGLFIGVGRALVGGSEAAATSRYLVFASLVWIAAPLAPGLIAGRRGRLVRVLEGVIAAAVATLLFSTQAKSFEIAKRLSDDRASAATALVTGQGINWPVLETLYGNPHELIPYLGEFGGMLRRHRLSLFRNATPSELDPPPWTGPLTMRIEATPANGHIAGIVYVAGGVPGNLAYGLIEAGGASQPQGAMTFDSKGLATLGFDILQTFVPPDAKISVVSIDRKGALIRSTPSPVPR